jgi:putative membrane protein
VRQVILVTASVLVTTLAFSATQQNSKGTTAKDVSAADKAFVVKALNGGMAEVELGKLATQKATSVDVKQFGQRMIDDHSKAGEELKTIAQSKTIAIPATLDAKAKALHDRLSKLSGAAFERSYMDAMVTDHRQAVEDFRRESTMGMDSEIKGFAAKTLPTIEEHLKMAMGTNSTGIGTSGSTQKPGERNNEKK